MSHLDKDVIDISESVAELSLLQRHEAERRLDDQSHAIIAWISPLNLASKQIDVSSKRQEGTGDWLLGADEFRSWLHGDQHILWCRGLRMLSSSSI